MLHTRNQAVNSTPAWWALALAVVWIAVSVLATCEDRQQAVKARRTFIYVTTALAGIAAFRFPFTWWY